VKIPRDLSANQLVRALSRLGYSVTRQTGSHVRLTTAENGEHHITIPSHDPLKVGTLSAILSDVAAHAKITRNQLLETLFD
jgi:predicted RNA binding protein YcfA (HicA-like mRNA interferase family)